MTDDELSALIDAETRQSYGYYGGKLANARLKASIYYYGEAKGDLAPPEIEGRSSVVSTDVRNTIESMMPHLMTKFVGGDSVVDFEPQTADDEQKAKLATDYCNYLFFKKNNGRKVVGNVIKDALLHRCGIVKVWWDKRDEEKREDYKGLDDVELSQIMDDEEVSVFEHTAYPDEADAEQRQDAVKQLQQHLQQAQQALAQQPQPPMQPGQQPPPSPAMQAVQQLSGQLQQIEQTPPKMLHDISVKRVKTGGKLTVEAVPPEEFLISRNAKSVEDARFVGHRVARTRSELKSMGYKNVDDLGGDDNSAVSWNMERIERMSQDDELAYLNNGDSQVDESQRIIWVVEAYIKVDADGDGIAELRKVVKAGNKILENDICDIAPFALFVPIPMPHKVFGLSIADLAMEGQRVKTSILRAYLDQLYLNVNGRMFAVEGQVNLDDLLTTRPGGVVRVKQPGMVGPLQPNYGDGAAAMNTLQYMEDFIENSTGWTRYSQGNDSGSLNHTATGVNIITNRADMRVDLVARNLSEGFVQTFKLMLKFITQYQDKEEIVRIAGQWVPIDPREWRNGFDCNINVGLGTGDKQQQVGNLNNLLQHQLQSMQFGVATPKNIYETESELAKAMGFKNGDKFFTDPSKQPPKPQPPNPEMAKVQAEAQSKQQQMQMTAQIEQQKMQATNQIEQAKIQMKMQADERVQQVQAQQNQMQQQMEAERAQAQAQMDSQLKLQEMEYNLRLESMKHEQTQETELRKAALQAAAQIEVARMSNPTVDAATAGQETDMMARLLEGQSALIAQLGRPKQIIRDANGRAMGVQ